jgi:hypothetical protein
MAVIISDYYGLSLADVILNVSAKFISKKSILFVMQGHSGVYEGNFEQLPHEQKRPFVRGAIKIHAMFGLL